MPGRHVTDHQMRLYMTFRQTDGPAVAAAKASISLATAYRFEQDHRPPSSMDKARTRRRADPLADFFDAEVIPMLKASPGLRAVAISKRCNAAIRISRPVHGERSSAASVHGEQGMARTRR